MQDRILLRNSERAKDEIGNIVEQLIYTIELKEDIISSQENDINQLRNEVAELQSRINELTHESH